MSLGTSVPPLLHSPVLLATALPAGRAAGESTAGPGQRLARAVQPLERAPSFAGDAAVDRSILTAASPEN